MLTLSQIEAVLDDRVNHTTSDFAGQAHDQSFCAHLENLFDFRKKRPVVYHTLMHEIVVAVTYVEYVYHITWPPVSYFPLQGWWGSCSRQWSWAPWMVAH